MNIEHIALNVLDPVALADWYIRHLGMHVVRQVDSAPFTRFLADAADRVVLEAYRQDAPVPDYAIVTRHGKVVDGTGNPWVYADLAIRGDKIVAVGRVSGTAKREIDARGLIVAPGFIDMHSHSDSLLLEDGNAPSKVRQGVTMEILGEGNSAGPYTGETRADGRGRFETLGGYFAAVEKKGIAVNVASYVGLDNVW